jgi:hypothetical protein
MLDGGFLYRGARPDGLMSRVAAMLEVVGDTPRTLATKRWSSSRCGVSSRSPWRRPEFLIGDRFATFDSK